MQTECPHCHTVFRIAQAQLDMAGGMVRCGYCKAVFNATSNEAEHNEDLPREPVDKAQQNVARQAGSAATITADDESLFPFGPGADETPKSYSALATTAWSLAILALIITLILEYIWFNQPEMLQHERFKPATARLCELIDCTHMQRRDASQIEMVSRNVYSHPNENNALMVSTTIVNNAPYAQPFPEVQIDFSDVRGGLLASRRFKPEEYLQTDNQPLDLLQSGTPVTFGLEIRDPGNQAITYEFSFH